MFDKIKVMTVKAKEKKATEAADRGLTADQMKVLLKAQRGELDAVWMYKRLAKKVSDEADQKAFVRLANDEQRHADVFYI